MQTSFFCTECGRKSRERIDQILTHHNGDVITESRKAAAFIKEHEWITLKVFRIGLTIYGDTFIAKREANNYFASLGFECEEAKTR